MGLKTFKPRSPGRRGMVGLDFSEITKTTPEKSLLAPIRKTGARNNNGRITMRHHGGGHKRRYRIIDFLRNKVEIPAKVVAIEYDPNRTARIALLQYKDGAKAYIIAPVGLSVGDEVISSPKADIKPGNALPLSEIPVGTVIHNVEMKPGHGAQICRAAGVSSTLVSKEGKYCQVKNAFW